MSENLSPLTQFIFVNPHQERHALIQEAARASALVMTHLVVEGLEEWLETGYRKSVRAIKRPQDFDLPDIAEKISVAPFTSVSAGATLPMRKEELPSTLRRAQVTGWEHKVLDQEPEPRDLGKHLLLLNESLGMSCGKAAAQAAHALMMFALAHQTVPYLDVVFAPEEVLLDTDGYKVVDNGLTEIPAGSLTAVLKH